MVLIMAKTTFTSIDNSPLVAFLRGLADGIDNGTIIPIETEVTKKTNGYKEYAISSKKTLFLEYASKQEYYSLKSDIE
jgi:tRNA U34 2-thiouridine synthase MnmA/TrmU